MTDTETPLRALQYILAEPKGGVGGMSEADSGSPYSTRESVFRNRDK
jgi:hypothetical protein